MARRLRSPSLLLAVLVFCPGLAAATPPLLARALAQWDASRDALAFTQRTRIFFDDGRVKEERVENYDPSLPDSQRWHLVEFDGKPPTTEQRRKWEGRKNAKPRKRVLKSAADYLDLDHATLAGETPTAVRFHVGLRPEAARLLTVEKIAIVITVDKQSGGVVRLAATLREPMRVLLGVANITDLDFDLGLDPPHEEAGAGHNPGEVKDGSTARVMMSKLGDPTEYRWSDFRRVTPFPAPGSDASSKPASAPRTGP